MVNTAWIYKDTTDSVDIYDPRAIKYVRRVWRYQREVIRIIVVNQRKTDNTMEKRKRTKRQTTKHYTEN